LGVARHSKAAWLVGVFRGHRFGRGVGVGPPALRTTRTGSAGMGMTNRRWVADLCRTPERPLKPWWSWPGCVGRPAASC